jgi:predicted metal-dependent phosphotriesterase family hydrolase
MQIMTVLGPIPAEEMGTAAAHEHLLCDASMWWRPPVEPSRRSVAYGPIQLQNRGEIFRNQWINRDNMVLDDERLAIESRVRRRRPDSRGSHEHGIGK